MEVNVIVPPAVTQRIHLLVIFPPDKEPAAIERIFAGPGNFPTDANRTGREDFRIQSLEACIVRSEAPSAVFPPSSSRRAASAVRTGRLGNPRVSARFLPSASFPLALLSLLALSTYVPIGMFAAS
jgi:hypothetical protein